MSNYRMFTVAEINFLQSELFKSIMGGFEESVQTTMEWFVTDEAKDFFQQRQYRITNFFNESGIAEQWSNIVESRAKEGADIVEGIYNYARDVRMGDDIREYTEVERARINQLCDYNYELIKDVTEEQIQGIREALIQDYAEGRNSRRTEILEKLEQIQLEPIHTFSPEQRARMIARTETNRASNIATLEQYRADGVTRVELLVNSDCEECNSHKEDEDGTIIEYTIDEALEDPIFHPNCSCRWRPYKDASTGLYAIDNEQASSNWNVE